MARPRIARGEEGAMAEAGSTIHRREPQQMGLAGSGPRGHPGRTGPEAASVQASRLAHPSLLCL